MDDAIQQDIEAVTSRKARVVYRQVESGFQIRVEPQPGTGHDLRKALRKSMGGWCQPGDLEGPLKHCFSVSVENERGLVRLLRYAFGAVRGLDGATAYTSVLPAGVRQGVSATWGGDQRPELVAEAKVRDINVRPTWPDHILERVVGERRRS